MFPLITTQTSSSTPASPFSAKTAHTLPVLIFNSFTMNTANNPVECDPMDVLPGDVAALCLSFLEVPTLLNAAQLVSRAWRDAIDGGLPAIWHVVHMDEFHMSDRIMAFPEVMKKSHGGIMQLKFGIFRFNRVLVPKLDGFHTLCNLRVLKVNVEIENEDPMLISNALPSFPLLEDLAIGYSYRPGDAVLPNLPCLTRLHCRRCRLINGLQNLPALMSLEFDDCSTDASTSWPASLRDIYIHLHNTFNPEIVERIASLPHLIRLKTDWAFAVKNPTFFSPPFNQLSFLSSPTFTQSVQQFAVWLHCRDNQFPRLPPAAIFNHLWTMTSLRKLSISNGPVSDQDMQGLVNLTHLERLSLSCITTLTREGLRVLCSLPHITKLSIAMECDCSFVAGCTHLRSLKLCVTHQGEVEAIAKLQRLTKLNVECRLPQEHAAVFSRFFKMHTLCNLRVDTGYGCYIPAEAFAELPTMSCLETVSITRIKEVDVPKMVDCLVQMPRLRHVHVSSIYACAFSKQDEERLRKSLPRLEYVSVHPQWSDEYDEEEEDLQEIAFP